MYDFSDPTTENVGSGDRFTTKKALESFSSLLDLACLLEISADIMMAEIALKAAKKCQADAAINISK